MKRRSSTFNPGPVSLPLLAALLTLASPCARGEVLTLIPVADTTLSQTYPENNFGAMPFFNSGTTQNSNLNRGLLKFDLAGALPPNSTIQSAALTLEVVWVPNEDFPSARFNLHRMLRPWGEGTKLNAPEGGLGQGSPATTNEATWTHRFAFTPEIWSQPGARAPDDFTSVISSGVTVGGMDQSPYTIPGASGLVADLQHWLDQPEENHGWVLLCQQEATKFTARRFGSREDEFNAPRLEVSFLVRPRIEATGQTVGQSSFAFTTRAGQSYAVEFKDALDSGDWQLLTNFGQILEATNVYWSDAASSTQRFYRILTQ